MPVHRHMEQEEQEGVGLAQPAGETVSRGSDSLPASRSGHQEDGPKLFTASHGRRVRNDRNKLKKERF